MESPSIAQIVELALDNFTAFATACFKIRRKDGTVGYLVPNRFQREILMPPLASQVADEIPIRVVYLKPRQVGSSTFWAAYVLWRCISRPNNNAMIVADKKDTARKILRKVRFGFSNLPAWFVGGLGISLEYETKSDLEFSNGSTLFITSAESKEPGRGETIHDLLLSEAAFYEGAEVLVRGAFAAVPDLPGTTIILESTGNGVEGFFPNYYNMGKARRGGWQAAFGPWFLHEEYQIPGSTMDELGELTDDEHILVAAGAMPENLAWRRRKIDSAYAGDLNAFRVEFPATDIEAFMSVQAVLFDSTMVQRRLAEVEERMRREGIVISGPEGPRFVDLFPGNVTMFAEPVPRHMYAIGADVGSGVAGSQSDDHSYSCADVVDVATGEQVAHLHEMIEPALFADHLYCLAMYYNMALIAPEVTGGHGLAVLNYLRERGYANLYVRRRYDSTSNQWVNQVGWNTSSRQKAMIVDHLRADFRTGASIVNHPETLREMLSFIRNEKGRLGAIPGQRDDRVMSMCIANHVRRESVAASLGSVAQEEEPEENEFDRRSYIRELFEQNRESLRLQREYDIMMG